MTSEGRKAERVPEDMGVMMREVEFEPTPDQEKYKVRVMSYLHDNPIYRTADLTYETCYRIVRHQRLASWWKQVGFEEWIQNRNEFREKAEYLLTLAMKRATTILQSTDAKMVGAQVNMIKMVLELTNRMPKENKGKDKEAPALDPGQLDEFLRLSGYVKLEEAKKLAIPMQVEVSSGEKEGEIH